MGNLSQEWIQRLHYLESWQEVEFIPGGSNPETLMTILPKKLGPGERPSKEHREHGGSSCSCCYHPQG